MWQTRVPAPRRRHDLKLSAFSARASSVRVIAGFFHRNEMKDNIVGHLWILWNFEYNRGKTRGGQNYGDNQCERFHSLPRATLAGCLPVELNTPPNVRNPRA